MTKRSVTMLGIDLGKSSCSLVGLDAAGAMVLRRRAALASMCKAEDATGRWLRGLLARAPHIVVVVALAAKLARIAWAMLRKAKGFERQLDPVAA